MTSKKYDTLLDGTLAAITSLIDVDNTGDLLPIVRDMSRVLAAAARFYGDPEFGEKNAVLIDAISGGIAELLDCIESDHTTGGLEVIANLSKALAEAARMPVGRQQALLMPGSRLVDADVLESVV